MRLEPASAFSAAELAAVFTAGYEGYFVPVHVDEPTFSFMAGAWDIDLERSRVALRDGEPIGLALLGVRRERGWIGGLGVAPTARRAGVGRTLMEAVLAEAPATVTLEVIEANEPAIRLYRELGFRDRRLLEVWSLTEAPPVEGETRVVDPRPLGQAGLPWQREDASLPPDYERLETEGGAALVRIAGPRVSVLQLEAADDRAAACLLAAARARGESLHYVNVPEGDPASVALRRLGAKLELRQRELLRNSA